jgi:methyl coenzyme M reductase gamma subunit
MNCAATMQSKKVRGRAGPARVLYAQFADNAYAASAPQIFMWRVSGIRNRLSTKHTAGTAIG